MIPAMLDACRPRPRWARSATRCARSGASTASRPASEAQRPGPRLAAASPAGAATESVRPGWPRRTPPGLPGAVNTKPAASPRGLSSDPDRAAVPLDDALADRQSEPGAGVAVPGGAVEGVEDPFALSRGRCRSRCRAPRPGPSRRRLGAASTRTSGTTPVATYFRALLIRLSRTWRTSSRSAQTSGEVAEHDAAVGQVGAVALHRDVLDHVAQRHSLAPQRLVAGDGVGQQVGDEAAHLLDPAPDVVDGGDGALGDRVLDLREVLLEGLRPPVDHAERVVQVVGDGAGEVGQGVLVGALQGDVADNDHRAALLARLGGQREGTDAEDLGGVVRAAQVLLLVTNRLARQGTSVGELLVAQGASVGMEDVVRRRGVDVAGGLDRVGSAPEDRAQRVVGLGVPAALLDDGQPVVEVVDHQVELGGAGLQRLLVRLLRRRCRAGRSSRAAYRPRRRAAGRRRWSPSLIGPSRLGARHSSAGTETPSSARVSGETASVSFTPSRPRSSRSSSGISESSRTRSSWVFSSWVPKAVRRAALACRMRPPFSTMATPSSRFAITRSSSCALRAFAASERARLRRCRAPGVG